LPEKKPARWRTGAPAFQREAIPVGLWLTRRAKGPGGRAGSVAKDAFLDRTAARLGGGEAYEDKKPEDY
jgi:hypothetical protein